MLEAHETFDELYAAAPEQWDTAVVQNGALTARVVKHRDTLWIFSPTGGMFILARNGQWGADIAPFSD